MARRTKGCFDRVALAFMLLIFLVVTVNSFRDGNILTAVIFLFFTLICLLPVISFVLSRTSDNAGGLLSTRQWLSIVLWVAVIGCAIYAVKIGAINGWLCAGIIIAAHGIVYIINQIVKPKKAEDISIPNNEANPNTITEEYYDLVTKAAEDVYQDFEKVLKLNNIESSLDSLGVTFDWDGAPITNTNEKIRLLFLIDIVRCYNGLGHIIDLDSKDGLGLFYIIALTTERPPKKSYANLATLKAEYMAEVEKRTKALKSYVDSTPVSSEVFLVSQLLAATDTKLQRKFLVDIYRFSSIIAKADNTVTDDEAKWLSNILKLQGKEDKEIVAQEEEEPIVPSIVINIPNLDPMFAEVARYVVAKQEGSISQLQRAFEIGYNRAGKLGDQLEAAGIVGPNKGPKGRDVLIKDMKTLDRLLAQLNVETSEKHEDVSTNITTPKKPESTSAMKELKSLIGLDSVKTEVETLTNFIKIQQTRANKGLKTSAVSYHCVFTGNPGTGKTTVARIVAKIYKGLGVVKKGHLIETDRAGLVAEYVGQTAVKTNKIIDSALDGVLFIDEAYSLISSSENDFGKEAIATLLKRMEDDRERLVVILAGYTKEMKDFIDSNPGLQSRFNRYIEFPDYNPDELFQIFMRLTKQYDYTISKDAEEGLKTYLEYLVAHKDANFGNGRLVRNVFEKTLERQANRLSHEVNLTAEKLSLIEKEDLPIK